jgi:hypothetical protein
LDDYRVAHRGGLYAIGWRAGIFEALADSPASIDALAAHRAAANGWRLASASSTSSTDTITDREVLPWRGGPHRG